MIVEYAEGFSVPTIPQNDGYSSKWIANENNSYSLKPGGWYNETGVKYTSFSSIYVKSFSIGDKEYEVKLGSKFDVPSYNDEKYTLEYWMSASGSILKCCETIDESLIKQESYSPILSYDIVFHLTSNNETMKITNEDLTKTYEIPDTRMNIEKHYKQYYEFSKYWIICNNIIKGGTKVAGFPIFDIEPTKGVIDAEIEYIRKISTCNRINRKSISSGFASKFRSFISLF